MFNVDESTVQLENTLGSIYPGDTYEVCIMIENEAAEILPFNAVFTGTESLLESYTLDFGSEVPARLSSATPGRLFGSFEFTVTDEADGNFTGMIELGRGTA